MDEFALESDRQHRTLVAARARGEQLRWAVIAAVHAGHSPTVVAAETGLSRRTIRRWVREFGPV